MSSTRTAYGWVLPRTDKHFPQYLAQAPKVSGRRMYQPQHIQHAVHLCRSRRLAVDVGAHVGFWSYYLAAAFATVHAFEPNDTFAHCFERNVRAKNVKLHRMALGEAQRKVELEVDWENTGATHVRAGSAGSIPMRRLDDYGLEAVDFIKIDVEGYERLVLEGARETLARCQPVVIVEQKEFSDRYGDERFAASELLLAMGAVQLAEVVKDRIFGWPQSRAVTG